MSETDADGDADEIEAIREQKMQELAEAAAKTGAEVETEAGVSDHDEPIMVDSVEQFDDLIEEHALVLVDFFAEWCGPCKMMEPAVESVAAGGPGVVLKADIDRLQELAQRHGIRGVPTIEVYRDGERV